MRQLEPDLWQTSRREAADGVYSHAYLLTRPSGNLLIYSLGADQDDDLDEIDALGGVALQVLSHRDESGPALNLIRERFGSQLACSELEVAAIQGDAEPDLILQERGGANVPNGALDGVEILDTPGHTPGSISLRYQSPHGKTYLFSGDTIVPNRGGWATAVYPEIGGDAEALEDSLRRLRETQPDLVIASAYGGDDGAVAVTREEWPTIVDHRIERLQQWRRSAAMA